MISDCAEFKCTNAFIEKCVCKKAVGNNCSFVETRCAACSLLPLVIAEKSRCGSREALDDLRGCHR